MTATPPMTRNKGRTLGIAYGALAPPLSKQLLEQGLFADATDLDHFEKDRDAILRLYLRNYLTDAQKQRALVRLQGRLAKAVKPLA